MSKSRDVSGTPATDGNALANEQLTADSSLNTFVSSLLFNIIIGVALFLLFCVLRTRNRNVFAPKTSYLNPTSKHPPKLSTSFLGWLPDLLQITDREIIRLCGLDAYVLLRYCHMSAALFTVFTLIALPILLPIAATDPGGQLDGLNRLTMGNITEKSRLWAYWLLSALFSALTVWVLHRELKRYMRLRHAYLISRGYRERVEARTILVTAVNKDLRMVGRLEEIFNAIGPVERIWRVLPAGKAAKKTANRNSCADELELAECELIRNGTTSNSVTEKEREQLVLLREEYVKRMESTEKQRRDQFQKEEDSPEGTSMAAAFVTFKRQRDAQVASQVSLGHSVWRLCETWQEPYPDAVIWSNLTVFGYQRWIRYAISMLIATVLVIVWSILITFVSGIASLSKLVSVLPFLAPILNWPQWLVGLIQGILPAVAVAVLMFLLPIILTKLSEFEGIPLGSEVQLSVMHKYYFFLIVNILLVASFASGIFSSLGQLMANPSEALTVLSATLPQASTFFITLVLLQGITGSFQLLLQLVQIVLKYIFRKLLAKTPRRLVKLKAPSEMEWGLFFPDNVLIFAIGITYSVVSPLILPFVGLFFVLHALAYRYLLLYCWDQPRHLSLGGRAFPRAIYHTFVGLYIHQVVMLGLFAIQKQVALIVLSALAIVATAAINRYMDRGFMRTLNYLPIEVGLKAERGEAAGDTDELLAVAEQAKQTEALEKQADKADAIEEEQTILADSEPSRAPKAMPVGSSNEKGTAEKPKLTVAQSFRHLLSTDDHSLLAASVNASSLDLASNASIMSNNDLGDYYVRPELKTHPNTIWLPRDSNGVTDAQVAELMAAGIPASAEGATFDGKRISVSVGEHGIPEVEYRSGLTEGEHAV